MLPFRSAFPCCLFVLRLITPEVLRLTLYLVLDLVVSIGYALAWLLGCIWNSGWLFVDSIVIFSLNLSLCLSLRMAL